MRIPSYWTTSVVIFFTVFLRQAICSGVFELRLKSFVNDYGKDSVGRCCSGENPSLTGECSGPCLTRFRVCLKHYQTKIDTTSPCTFGDVITPVLGENSVNILNSKEEGFVNPITFKFDFSWPGTFSLILEAWHDNNYTSRSSGGSSRTLITRLTTQKWLDPGEIWTEEEHKSSHSSMKYEFRVICDPHYYGSGCANLCRPRDDKFGHYSCASSGARVCDPGWKGTYCDEPKCLPGCNETHGHCEEPDQCICHKGWQGKFCDECERYPGCLHGTCQKQWECICDEGWGGLFCNQDLNYCTNHKPCQHGGTCFNTGQGSYTCSCPPGFTGTDCEHVLDGCSNNPCSNGGVCKDHGNGYSCECPKGFQGDHCEVSTITCSDIICHNGGTCQDTLLGYKCRCTAGYTGLNCDLEIDDCNPNPCYNGGTCLDKINGYLCSCPLGFTGSRCETNIDDCVSKVCYNGGTCIDLIGSHRCQCVPGYVGEECQSKVDYCRAKPCANGATCKNLVNDYECTCRPGFLGKDCSIDKDECISSPCKNGATCINRVNNFECRCPTGFRGRHCEIDVTDGSSTTSGLNMYWRTGNMSKHVSERVDDSGLSTEHVVVIATFSTAVPVLVLVGAVVVMCMKQKRKREQQKADEEARMQNEQNTVHSSMSKRGVVGGAGDAHMIKNTWGKSINNVLAASQTSEDRGGGTNVVSVSENVANSELCYSKQPDPGPLYALLRTRSQKQLNTETAVHRQSQRASALLDKCLEVSPHRQSSLLPGSKLDKDLDSLCSPSSRASDQRISILSIDSSLCNSSETQLVKRPFDKESQSSLLGSGTPASSGVYVIEEHFLHPGGPGTLATEV